jgi:hypothetical protein
VGIQQVGGNSYLSLSYRQAVAATDLTFTTELNAGDLLNDPWTAGGVAVGSPVPNNDGTQTVTIRDTVPMTAATQSRFIRLRVTGP